MDKKKLIIIAFIVLSLVQLYVPASIILSREKVIKTGKIFKFKTAPIDPTDPFRGKYITLSFEDTSIEIDNTQDWNPNQKVYVAVMENEDGFAEISAVSKTGEDLGEYYFEARVNYATSYNTPRLFIDFPFDRFYMEESKAYPAEEAYRESQSDALSTTYAIVSIRNGEAVLQEVQIDGISIKEIVEKADTLNNQ